ncbi:MAG: hypothetical protein M1820_003183 [Bogoriella megaspora]|nr:MAG: hypothetical protein M1820_003183 [Bogoriella megaspora]
MWKRLQNRGEKSKESKESTIGRPQLIETTYQDGSLSSMPTISGAPNASYTVSVTGGNVQRPQVERLDSSRDKVSELPPLPFRSLEVPTQRSNDPNRNSVAQSSIYSQPSPEFDSYKFAPPEPTLRVVPGNISEPSTREPSVDGDRSPVSPVESTASASRWKSSSRIPIRKPTPTNGDQITRWDDYSGEPTINETGKSGQVRPGTFEPLRGSPSSGSLNRFGLAGAALVKERTAKLGAQSQSIDARPPWKGASGRQATVTVPAEKPVREKPLPVTTPLSIPPHKQRRASGPQSSTSARPGTVPGGPTPASPRNVSATLRHERSRDPNAHPISRSTINATSSVIDDEEEIKPIPPLKAGLNSPTNAQFSSSPSNQKSRTNYPSTPSPGPGQTNGTPNGMPNPREASLFPPRQSSMPASDDHGPSSSRFSWSTHATGTTYQQQSPPPSPPPPMPATFTDSPHSISPSARTTPPIAAIPGGVLSRSRPVPTSGMPGRKPVPSRDVTPTTPIKIELGERQANLNVKALPLSPPEMQGKDPVASLQQQSDALEKRRFNLEKHVRELESPQHRNPLQYDLRAQREIERRIANLKVQVEELRREEHDVGLRLHRAWKKRDDGEESTTLWVRRIAM